MRRVYDPAFRGAGNWAFNTAYAATRGLRGYVTRLRDLTEAERFVAAGIPLVVSVTFRRDELDGAGYDTNGHLLTIVGFTADGDVVSNDPNSHTVASNDQVRTVYRRDQFERVWLGDDGGLAYVWRLVTSSSLSRRPSRTGADATFCCPPHRQAPEFPTSRPHRGKGRC